MLTPNPVRLQTCSLHSSNQSRPLARAPAPASCFLLPGRPKHRWRYACPYPSHSLLAFARSHDSVETGPSSCHAPPRLPRFVQSRQTPSCPIFARLQQTGLSWRRIQFIPPFVPISALLWPPPYSPIHIAPRAKPAMTFGVTERWQGLQHLTLRCFAFLLTCNDALAAGLCSSSTRRACIDINCLPVSPCRGRSPGT